MAAPLQFTSDDAKRWWQDQSTPAPHTAVASASRHGRVFCDSCSTLIGDGVRWKCTVCYDTDFCSACRLSPNQTALAARGNRDHDETYHPLLMLNHSNTDTAKRILGKIANTPVQHGLGVSK